MFGNLGVPLWLFMLTAVLALLIGKGLRWYWFRRKARIAEAEEEERKQRKIQLKRQKKLMKKAAKKER